MKKRRAAYMDCVCRSCCFMYRIYCLKYKYRVFIIMKMGTYRGCDASPFLNSF